MFGATTPHLVRNLSLQGARFSLTHPALPHVPVLGRPLLFSLIHAPAVWRPKMSSEKESHSSFSLKSLLENEKLNNTNFIDWHRNMRIVLKMAKKLYVIEGPVPNEPKNNTAAARRAWDKHNEDAIEVACLMQDTMCFDL
ncbi:hypothetical protein L1987_01538 [Smallanthus sonchifolius]|uniref:Uncharacterized protein n=1 Tax=Smallanthus sonchifolius TaxID=185202 RepID=A0ACB9K5C5_9ASTR|nr:hypothetical protein L1987_01538 [Smallanthus sonchifolius]